MGWEWKGGCIILQAQIIDHMWDYIEKTIHPKRIKIEELWLDFDYEMRRLQQQLLESDQKNQMLECKIEKLTMENLELEEKLRNLGPSKEHLESVPRREQGSEFDNSLVV